MELKVIALIQTLLIGGAFSHSWIACTDYLQENGNYWSSSYCRAYARGGNYFTKKESFGLDTGYNYHASDSQACRGIDGHPDYTDEYRMATYYIGQKVVIAHPTKNHVAENCTNKYIPDNGNYVYRSEVNPVSDPSFPAFKQNEVVNLGKSPFGHETPWTEINTYPKPGKQNAPKFCENMDKALATSAFYIPNDLQPGRYTFLWAWSFNGPTDTYSSCWEADVVYTKEERNDILNSHNLPTSEPEVLYGKSLAPVPDGVVTQAPATQAPVTQAPVTQAPATQAPATQAPATQAPATQAPATQQPCSGQCTVPPTLQCMDACLQTCYGNP